MRASHLWSRGLAALVAVGCSGAIGDGEPTTPSPGPPDQRKPPEPPRTDMQPLPVMPPAMVAGAGLAGPMPLRRLTREEYDYTALDLLGDTSRPGLKFPEDSRGAGGFLVAGAVGALELRRLMESAEDAAARAAENLGALLPCDPKAGEDRCAAQFIESFTRRAYRRRITAANVAPLQALYTQARRDLRHDFKNAIRVVLQAVLQSSGFLYRWELGRPQGLGRHQRPGGLHQHLQLGLVSRTVRRPEVQDRLLRPVEGVARRCARARTDERSDGPPGGPGQPRGGDARPPALEGRGVGGLLNRWRLTWSRWVHGLEQSRLGPMRARECRTLVPEQLRLGHRVENAAQFNLKHGLAARFHCAV